ncbi:uncharacterized protein LOC117727791 isoform X2 [Cyclopterus lumpus]|uniref:uncharacterized protein LOC117727791 isoform X2 n=1 Tax=Cyclopterus lumpus TaxID=8103 RepID=UPI0014864412|nr:uncharacterized protein LOC117727791 isoform X2 [Cyclopterus lumpus]
MAELRRIVTSSFLMLQVLSSTASVKYSFFTVRAGDEVTLLCGNVTPDQDEFNRITWLFTGSRKAEILFEYGKIHKEAYKQYKSDRLSVSEKCSLVIKKVSDEDGGRYICREFRTGTQEYQDAVVHLSVVTMTEQKNPDEVTFICSVVSYSDICIHRVKWMNEGKENDVVTSQRPCSAWLTIKKSHVDQKSYELLKCEVTDGYSGRVHQFPFLRPPSSDDAEAKTTTKSTTTTTLSAATTTNKPEVTNNKTSENGSNGEYGGWRRSLVFGSVAAASLLIIVVSVLMCKRTKGKKTKTDGDVADSGEGVSYASVSYTKNTGGGAQAGSRRDDDEDDEGHSVTYSTVKPRFSSAAASVDPGDLYASVYKPNKCRVTD